MTFSAVSPIRRWHLDLDTARSSRATTAVACHILKASRKKGWGWVRQSIRQIAKYLRLHPDTIRVAIKWLEKNGFIVVGRNYRANQYKIAFDCTEISATVEEVSDSSLRSPSEPKGPEVQADARPSGSAKADPADTRSRVRPYEYNDIPLYLKWLRDGEETDPVLTPLVRSFDKKSLRRSITQWRTFIRDSGNDRWYGWETTRKRLAKWLRRERYRQWLDIPYNVVNKILPDYFTGAIKL